MLRCRRGGEKKIPAGGPRSHPSTTPEPQFSLPSPSRATIFIRERGIEVYPARTLPPATAITTVMLPRRCGTPRLPSDRCFVIFFRCRIGSLRTCLLTPVVIATTVLLLTATVQAQQVAVEEFTLDNGMQFLLVPRTDQPDVVSAGWVARVGSVNERPGITGISHFFEHMMLKGTGTIGTRDPEKDARFRIEQQAVRDEINRLVWTGQYGRFFKGEIEDPGIRPTTPSNSGCSGPGWTS